MTNLQYDKSKWQLTEPELINRVQLFITNKCNKRCKGCFYGSQLDNTEMTFEEYKEQLDPYIPEIGKVILIGGEPTISPYLQDMIEYNRDLGLSTTIYTNGYDLSVLEEMDLTNVFVRIGVLGLNVGEKPLIEITPPPFPVFIVYMLRKDNVHELMSTALYAEENFNCSDFMISSIRDIEITRDFWRDTEETVRMGEYFDIVQDFIDEYDGNMHIHISRRGIIDGKESVKCCRFLNFFPKKKEAIICPLDISLQTYCDPEKYSFNTRQCNKNHECILQKIVLERK